MTARAAGRLTFGFLIVMTAAVTWPGVVYFNRIEPRIFGLPFNFAWVAAWIVLGFAILGLLEWTVTREEDAADRSAGRER